MISLLRFCFLFCIASGFAQNIEFSPLSVDSSLKENADSVVREEHIILDLTDPRMLEQQVYRVVSVYNKAGNSDVQAYAFYDDDRKVKDISARIYNALGKEIKRFKSRDFKDVSAVSGGSLYEDDRVLFMDYTPTSYPYTVVFKATTQSKTTAFLPRWIPVTNYASSTQSATFKIHYDPSIELNIKEERLEAFNISHDSSPGHHEWKAENIKALAKEYLSPSFQNLMPVVKCAVPEFSLKGVSGTASSWENFGSWMNDNLLADTKELPETTVNTIKTLVQDLDTKEAKARAVYDYVQQKVRYISVQEGIGGWKPMYAEDVDKLGYGDCKALSNYTQSLLHVAGVPSYYTVLYAGDAKRSIDKDFIAMQGNHAILAVPLEDRMEWLECTSQEVPFGYLGSFTDDRDVLLVTGEGGKIAHTKKYKPSENLEKLTASVNLTLDGGLVSEVQKQAMGVLYHDKLKLQHLSDADLKKHYLSQWGNIQRLQLNGISHENNRDSIIFSEKIKINATGYLTPVSNSFLMPLNPFALNSDDIPTRDHNRETPFTIERGIIKKVELTYNLPEGYRPGSLPDAIIVEAPFGKYTSKLSQEGSQLLYTREFMLNENLYKPSQYESFRAFYKDVVQADSQKILLEPQS